jgi:hypothetical protein
MLSLDRGLLEENEEKVGATFSANCKITIFARNLKTAKL